MEQQVSFVLVRTVPSIAQLPLIFQKVGPCVARRPNEADQGRTCRPWILSVKTVQFGSAGGGKCGRLGQVLKEIARRPFPLQCGEMFFRPVSTLRLPKRVECMTHARN